VILYRVYSDIEWIFSCEDFISNRGCPKKTGRVDRIALRTALFYYTSLDFPFPISFSAVYELSS